jgi:hypothetical protein
MQERSKYFKKARLIATFNAARDLVSSKFPQVAEYGFEVGCPLVEQANRKASRSLMHVLHKPGIICVARAALKQDRRHLLGLWLHEFGHVVGGPAQYDADSANWENFRIPIQYDENMIEFVEL